MSTHVVFIYQDIDETSDMASVSDSKHPKCFRYIVVALAQSRTDPKRARTLTIQA